MVDIYELKEEAKRDKQLNRLPLECQSCNFLTWSLQCELDNGEDFKGRCPKEYLICENCSHYDNGYCEEAMDEVEPDNPCCEEFEKGED